MSVRPSLLLLLNALYEKLEDAGTHPHLVQGIRICTDLWLHPGRLQRPERLLQDLHFSIRNVLCKLYSFGWLRFMQGLHLSSLLPIQSSYFQYKNVQRSVDKWHSTLIVELWYILEKVYFHRCEALENKKSCDEEDHPALIPALNAARMELARGLRTMPQLYHQYFSHTQSTLGDLDAASLQQWLNVIRLNREHLNDANPTADVFSPGGKYRSWLIHES